VPPLQRALPQGLARIGRSTETGAFLRSAYIWMPDKAFVAVVPTFGPVLPVSTRV
jgi:hypothetical protein